MAKKKGAKIQPQKKWKAGDLLYKYRGLDPMGFLIDIIRNKMLFAASYTKMNDPMEGMYRYSFDVPEHIRQMIKYEKLEYHICALSKRKDSTLMWSHYSDSHRGIVLGVRPRFTGNSFEEIAVEYIDDLKLIEASSHPRENAKKVLSKKLKPWSYEEEIRVLTRKNFVPIEIEEVLIGCKADKTVVERIKFLFERTVDEKNIKQLHRDELDVNMES